MATRLVISAVTDLKRTAPDTFIVLGGIGPSPVAAPLMEYCPAIDAIVVGEGERTFVELVRRVEGGGDLGDVAGIVYRRGAEVVATNARPRVAELGQLERPAYHHVDFSRYRAVDVQFSRGCPFPCSFCDIAPFWSRTNTKRSIAHFVDEIENLVLEHGVHDVFVIDDTFVLDRRSVAAFCDELVRRRLDISWACYARIDLMDYPLIERMALAGCKKLFFGVESGSVRVMEEAAKPLRRGAIVSVVKDALGAIPFVTTSFVWGFPGETYEDFRETVDLLLYLTAHGASPQFNLLVPYAYSTLFGRYRDQLLFEPQCSSQLQFYSDGERPWCTSMVASRPDLFSVFYRLPTAAFEQKWAYLSAHGIDALDWQREYFESAAEPHPPASA